MTEMQRDMVKLHLHRYNDYVSQTVQKWTVCETKVGHLRPGTKQTADSPGSSRRVRTTSQLPPLSDKISSYITEHEPSLQYHNSEIV